LHQNQPKSLLNFFFNEKLNPIGAKPPIFIDPKYKQCPPSEKRKKLKDRDHVLCSIHLPSPCFPIFFLHIYLLSCPLFALRMRQNLINTILRTLNITGRLLRKLHVFFPLQMKAKIC